MTSGEVLSYPPPDGRPWRARGMKLLRATRWVAKRVGIAAYVLIFLVALTLTFGITYADYVRIRVFSDSAERWQKNPDFRQTAYQYVTQGSDAMRIRACGFTAADGIIGVRSLPFLPEKFRVNPTSYPHYAAFSRGPLSAYLHLCWEQDLANDDGTGGYLAHLSYVCENGQPDAAAAKAWLAGLAWDRPVANDEGAVQSLRAMLRDIDLRKDNPLRFRAKHVDVALRAHIKTLAAELNVPPEPEEMTAAQQGVVLDRLDGYVKRVDPELWRTKQISDLNGGIWAQVFGPPYNILLVPYMRATEAAPWVCLAMIALAIFVQYRRLRARWAQAAVATKDPSSNDAGEAGPQGMPTPA